MLIAIIMQFDYLRLVVNTGKEHIIWNTHVVKYAIAREIIYFGAG